MATQEIKSTNWKAFCNKFIELHRGALMTVTKIELNGNKVEVLRDMPLTKVWMDSDGCNDKIFLRFEQEGQRAITHEIIEPIHVKLRDEGGGQKGLQFDAENGSTLVLFRSGHLDELLQSVERD